MNVSSLPYVALVLVMAPLYALSPRTIRPWLLLLVSLAFYGSFNWAFLPILLAVILASWLAGLTLDGGRRSPWLVTFWLLVVLAPLLFYKYLLFWFTEALIGLVPTSGLDFGGYGAVLIPVGLSFFTFQGLGYVIDIQRGLYPPERNPARLALFISLFPQLLAGPIERYPSLAPQLRAAARPSPDMVLDGLVMLFYGLFLKVCLGDGLGVTVDAAYEAPDRIGAATALVGIYGFTFQLFADFAGYSFIALGAAALFGVRLTQNFKQPFFSRSIVEFWQRWHISLTRWIGDYLYRPLGMRVIGVAWLPRFWQEALTFFIVWLVMGLWHGASWTFVLFGLLQAGMMLAYGRWSRGRRGLPTLVGTALGMLLTFHLVVLTFGLIRAPSVTAYGDMLAAMLSAAPGPVKIADRSNMLVLLAIVLAVETARRFPARMTLGNRVVDRVPWLLAPAAGLWQRCLAIAALILLVILMGHDEGRTFIYFRF
ncbi:MAG: MBOAT family O-acyltransferase [Alphaproteobacteria bacterium]|nr:MBOAT family O-acyltransferase [Alphaproteobacteria bacterium]